MFSEKSCPTCGGTGIKNTVLSDAPDPEDCPDCYGSGSEQPNPVLKNISKRFILNCLGTRADFADRYFASEYRLFSIENYSLYAHPAVRGNPVSVVFCLLHGEDVWEIKIKNLKTKNGIQLKDIKTEVAKTLKTIINTTLTP